MHSMSNLNYNFMVINQGVSALAAGISDGPAAWIVGESTKSAALALPSGIAAAAAPLVSVAGVAGAIKFDRLAGKVVALSRGLQWEQGQQSEDDEKLK